MQSYTHTLLHPCCHEDCGRVRFADLIYGTRKGAVIYNLHGSYHRFQGNYWEKAELCTFISSIENNWLSNKTWILEFMYCTTLCGKNECLTSIYPSTHPSNHSSIQFTTSGLTHWCNHHGNNNTRYEDALISIPHTLPPER